ncbi:DNA polymerase IV [Oligella sp. MSHR50489EDL]|uniref:DNA polymerase IV n=1 Tax=Oligella sp. MSHR50489EDL TaxID=3139409 RepID=UPI003D8191D0
MRKIIHIDMDAFYVSVELRDRPELKGQPVVVAWDGPRSVVCAASYEVREFGVHSAMSVAKAKQLCPQAIYIAPDFSKYRAVSQQIHEIFRKHTDVIEPISLDEAYLDVTENKLNIPIATEIAQLIRRDIFETTGLTASAGVAPNKFIAKIASDWHKPNGIKVVSPQKMMDFLLPLPVQKIPGVGRVTLAKMHRLKIYTVADLKRFSLGELAHHFGSYGYRLYQLSKGVDRRPVKAEREPKQISAENTFMRDLGIEEIAETLAPIAEKVAGAAQRKGQFGYCVTLRLKTADFRVMTRSITLSHVLHEADEILQQALHLLEQLSPEEKAQRYRLAGIGISQFLSREDAESQLSLF